MYRILLDTSFSGKLKNNKCLNKSMVELSESARKMAKEAEEWAEKQKLLHMSEISIILESYDSIFSDFDPRTYAQRSLSVDFLTEIKRATRENKSGVIELNLLIPVEKKNDEVEAKVRKRLHEYFRKHYDITKREVDAVRSKGAIMIGVGLSLSMVAAVFVYPTGSTNILNNIILVLIEPAAWFTIWEGANKVFDTWRVLEPDLEFFRKMIKSEITFTRY